MDDKYHNLIKELYINEYKEIYDKCKQAEDIIINSEVIPNNDYNSVIVINYLIDKNINYNDTKFIIQLYLFIVRNISIIKKIITNNNFINYKSLILENELNNLYTDYNNFRVLKNSFIIKLAFLSTNPKEDDEVIKRFHLLYFCNPTYLDNIMEQLP